MKAVVLSDNHTNYDFETPEGDILIHCGDFTFHGNPKEMEKFKNYLKEQPHEHKLFVWGNHELIEKDEPYWRQYLEYESGAKCIHNKEFEIDGLKFFGSSVTPVFGRWAFMKDDDGRKRHWENAPDNVDVVISHGPPFGLLDTVKGLEIEPGKPEHLGCIHLRKYVEKVQPKLVAHGHIHDSYGQMTLKTWDSNDDIICVNASLLNEQYEMVNKPVIVEIN